MWRRVQTLGCEDLEMIGYHKDPNLKESSVKSRFTVLVLVDQKLRIDLRGLISESENLLVRRDGG